VSEPALQPVHVTIKQFGLTDGTERHVDLTVAVDHTLSELFAAIAPEHRSARGLTWRFQIGERVLDWAVRIGTIRNEYAATQHYPDGVLWLDLLYFADRPVANDFVFRPPGSEPGLSQSSEANLPTLPDVTLPSAPGAAPAPTPPLPNPPLPPASARPSPPRPPAPPAPDKDEDEDWDEEFGLDETAETAPPPTAARAKYKRKSCGGADGTGEHKALTERRATVRYYTRMNPDRMFPLLVILSREQIQEVVKKSVTQAASESFKVEEGSLVEVEPVLPGCDCYPPRHALAVEANGPATATIWIVPRVLGRIQGARVLIRQGDRVLAEVPLDIKVAKQTLAVACGLMSLAAPYMTMGLKSLQLDYESQKASGFPLYQQVGSWLVETMRPEWIGLGFLGLAVVLYLLMRPRKRDVFWDVNVK
jgi:hypothetical protein